LLSLPRDLGTHPVSGKKVIVNIGRFGPYVGHDGKFKSIPRADNIFDISLGRAVELLAQAREGNTVLRVLGDHPDDKTSVEICSGRYGPYVRHGKINATLPKGVSPDTITLEEALELIAAKAAKGDGGGGKTGKAKKPAAKTTKAKEIPKTAKPKTTKEKIVIKVTKPASKKVAAGKVTKPITKKVVATKKTTKSKINS
jgi:DNA topoisomerase-1